MQPVAARQRGCQELATAAQIDLTHLGNCKSDPAKMLLAAALRAEPGVSNGWLCARLGMGTSASVSQFVRRWLSAETNTKSAERLRRGVSKVTR